MFSNCIATWLTAAIACASPSWNPWLKAQDQLTRERLLDNISREDVLPGAIVAATSRRDPNYYSHWVRDAGIVMLELNQLYRQSDEAKRDELFNRQVEHLGFSRHIQSLDNPAGPAYGAGNGEVRFNPDGTTFNAPWGRPQHDGPALRALSMMEFYEMAQHHPNVVPEKRQSILDQLYTAPINDRSLIKSDLEYVAHFWRRPSVDLWEELSGTHFYTLMTIRAALEKGAQFAEDRNDPDAAAFYQGQASQIEQALERHWIASKDRIAPTIDYVGGLQGKTADLDISILLAALHAELPGRTFDILDNRVIRSMTQMLEAMNNLYAINRVEQDFEQGLMAPAVGRYPEDVYDGVGFSGGNPWFLATLAYAEWMAEIVLRAQNQDVIVSDELARFVEFFDLRIERGELLAEQEQAVLLEIADRFFRRVRMHSDPRSPNDPNFSGRMNEQFDRNNGHMRGAENLTWSYGAFQSAFMAYDAAKKNLLQ